MANQIFSGFLYDDGGDAVPSATVNLYDRNTTTPSRADTTTNSAGYWTISHSTEGRFDVEITSGSSKRRIKYDEERQFTTLEVANLNIRNPADTFDYSILPAAIVADRVLTLPLITATDTLPAIGLAQTWSAVQTHSANISLSANADIAFTGTTGTNDIVLTNGLADALSITDGSADIIVVNTSTSGNVTTFTSALSVVSTYDAAATIYLRENAGTSGTIKIHADQGTSVTEAAESINILSDAGGVGIRSTANLAKAINLTSDGGTTGSIAIFNDQGTSVAEGTESISILSDDGGVGIRSTANLAKAINLTSDGGATGSIAIFNDQGTSVTEGAESISLLSDVGGVGIRSTANLANAVNITVDGGTTSTMTLFNDQGTAATEGAASIQLLSDAGGVNIKSGLNGANAILLTADGGTSETIVIHADQGSGTGSIELLSDAGGIELDAGTDIILDAGGADIFLKDDGTLFGTLNNNSGELLIKSSSSGTTAATFSGANVTFAGTVDATTDFTIGSTVITDDVITFTPSSSDTVTLTSSTNGAFSLVTVDDAAAAANIQITADGTVDIDSAGVLTLDSGAAINIEPEGGSVILLDGTISIDAGVVTGATSITSTAFVGTLSTAAQPNVTSLGTLAAGLTFPATQVASASANNLDDYEEGTFTPTLTDTDRSDKSQVYAIQIGRYTKIGNRVMFTCRLKLTDYGSMTVGSAAIINGLPFTSSSAANSNSVVSFGYCDSLEIGASESLTGFTGINDTYIDIYVWNATDGPNVVTLAVLSDDNDDVDLMFSGSYEV